MPEIQLVLQVVKAVPSEHNQQSKKDFSVFFFVIQKDLLTMIKYWNASKQSFESFLLVLVVCES